MVRDVFKHVAVIVNAVLEDDLSGPEAFEQLLLAVHVSVDGWELHVVGAAKGLLDSSEGSLVVVECLLAGTRSELVQSVQQGMVHWHITFHR